jgi:hypothetical protein
MGIHRILERKDDKAFISFFSPVYSTMTADGIWFNVQSMAGTDVNSPIMMLSAPSASANAFK